MYLTKIKKNIYHLSSTEDALPLKSNSSVKKFCFCSR